MDEGSGRRKLSVASVLQSMTKSGAPKLPADTSPTTPPAQRVLQITSTVVITPVFTAVELAELKAAEVHLDALSPLQLAAVEFMKVKIQGVSSDLQPCEAVQTDARLLRFLRSQQWDCADAWEAYDHFLHFRHAHGLDLLVADILSANKQFFTAGDELLRQIHFHPASLQSEIPYPRMFTKPAPDGHNLLYDRHGNLLVMEKPGSADFPGLVALGIEDWLEALTWHNELRVLVLDELSRRQNTLVRVCSVLDMGGLKVSLMMPGGGSKVEQEGFKAWQSGSKVLSKNYPDTTFRNYMINVPAAWLVDALISSTAPARSKDKFKIFSKKDNFRQALAVDVAPDQLPSEFGGELEWQPPPPPEEEEEEDMEESSELSEEPRVRKRGAKRALQRLGHWVHKDHPDYDLMSKVAVDRRNMERERHLSTIGSLDRIDITPPEPPAPEGLLTKLAARLKAACCTCLHFVKQAGTANEGYDFCFVPERRGATPAADSTYL